MYNSQIKTFEDACKFLAIAASLPLVAALPAKHQKAVTANYRLTIIAEALDKEANDGKEWIPDWNDEDSYKYYPWFRMWDDEGSEPGSGFSFFVFVDFCDRSSVGSRLVYISSDVARYAGTQFLEDYRAAFCLPQQVETVVPPAEEASQA